MWPEQEIASLKQILRSQRSDKQSARLNEYLRLVNEHSIRDSLFVAPRGARLLTHSNSDISENEKWTVHEQVARAALDCGNLSIAQIVLQALLRRFPDSARVQAVKGMRFEACGQYDAAEELYTRLSKQPAGATIGLKRLAALERTKGDNVRAADALRRYLNVYTNDKDAWEELAELYVQLCMYKQAAFCYEELLLHGPHEFKYHIRVADVLYTMGGQQYVKQARAHYSEAVVLSGGNSLRALYGIIACGSAVPDKDASSVDLVNTTGATLETLYEAADSYKRALVSEAVLS